MQKIHIYLTIILLVTTTSIAFERIANNEFINYDDNIYITDNNHIQSGINAESIKWAFTSLDYFYWHPFTWLSHMLDWHLFGARASGHHLVNLILHIGSVILLFLFLNKATNSIWSSVFAAAYFAIHPLRVESVAWAAERKDVLCMFLGMASIYAYSFYTEGKKLFHYSMSLIFFGLGLMSKPTLVTLPFILMLLDYWPLQRWQNLKAVKLIWEKIPFIILTIVSCIITIWAHAKLESFASFERLSFFERFIHAIVFYVAYLGKIIWPVNLAVFYPYEFYIPIWTVFGSATILIAITIIVLYYFRKLPFLFVGWFMYFGSLVPVIGLTQAGSQSIADRHTYLPFIGVAIMVSFGVPFLIKNDTIHKKVLLPVAIIFFVVLAALTWKQCDYWKNSMTLFSYALQVTTNNYLAYNNIACVLAEQGKIDEAIDHYNEAIRLNPDFAPAYNDRGIAYAKNSKYQQAIGDFSEAIRLQPTNINLFNNRGIAYFMKGNNDDGCRDVQKACSMGKCIGLTWAKVKGYCN